MQSARTKIYIVIGIIIVLLLSTLLYSLFTISGIRKSLEVQVNTRTIIIGLKDNLTDLLNAETGERGFFITGDTSYLQPYYLAEKNLYKNLSKIRILMQGNRAQQSLLDSLNVAIEKKLEYSRRSIALRIQGDDAWHKEDFRAIEGKQLMDRIRSVNQQLLAAEEQRFSSRQQITAQSILASGTVFVIEGVMALLITLLLAAIIINELNRRNRVEKRIREYNLELERKNSEIEQFAFAASHDLQEPLRTISNFSQLVHNRLADSSNEEAKRYIGLINSAASRMSALIHNLLEYSRIGRDTNKTYVDCNKLVREVLSDLTLTIQETRAQVKAEKLPIVNGYSYLKSVFQNLVTNAIKFRKNGVPPVITITAEERNNEFVFTVADNGIGIEKIYHDKIFLLFQRLHTRSEYPGTGIGLTQVRKIVELHGGRIWVESEVGKGTIFNFTIPK
jgi:signal transduction histidine kinase